MVKEQERGKLLECKFSYGPELVGIIECVCWQSLNIFYLLKDIDRRDKCQTLNEKYLFSGYNLKC